MGIEGPVGVQVIEGKEDQLTLDEKKLGEIMEGEFEGDKIELDFKLSSVIDSINKIMDKLLNIKTFDRGTIDADDGIDENKIITTISDKLNRAIKNYSDSEEDTFSVLISSLDNIGKGVELAENEQGYYDEFKSILSTDSILKNKVAGYFPNLNQYAQYGGGEVNNIN